MAEGGIVSGAGFEFYEGIRIIVPGTIIVATAIGIGRTFDFRSAHLGDTTIGGAAAALIAGLFLYFIDAPAKAAICGGNVPRTERPSDALASIGEPKTGTSVNTYFVVLDTIIPAGIRTRALYMGTMFRIGFEAIYLAAFAGTGVLLALTTGAGPTTASSQLDARVGLMTMLAASIAIILFVARTEWAAPGRDEWASPGRRDYLVLAASVLWSIAATIALRRSSLLTVGPGIGFILWAWRYFGGWSPKSRPKTAKRESGAKGRCPASRLNSVVLLGVPTVETLTAALVAMYGRRHPQATHIIPWAAVLVVTLAMTAARGHEKRLFGSYATQNAWLRLHSDKLFGEYLDSESAKAEGPTVEGATARASRWPTARRTWMIWILAVLLRLLWRSNQGRIGPELKAARWRI